MTQRVTPTTCRLADCLTTWANWKPSAGPAADDRAAASDRLAEDLQEGGDVAGQAIDADQDGQRHRAGPDALDQPSDQGQITLTTDHPTQPQPRWHRQRQGPSRLSHQPASPTAHRPAHAGGRADPAPPHARGHAGSSHPRKPARHRPLIKPERRHDGLRRAAITQQREHQHRQLGRLVADRTACRPSSRRSACTADTAYRCSARLWITMFPLPTTPRSEQSGCGRIAPAGPSASSR